jgi:hypothetical protein
MGPGSVMKATSLRWPAIDESFLAATMLGTTAG